MNETRRHNAFSLEHAAVASPNAYRMKPVDRHKDLIENFPFARAMRSDTRDRLEASLQPQALQPGVDILHPGETVDGVFLIRAGAIRVYWIDPNGREGTLYWIEPGESCILALNSLFTEMPYPAWAAAENEGAQIYTIEGAVFRELFAQDPAVQKFLFEQLSERVYAMLRLLEGTMRMPQEERLAQLLLARADKDGVVHLSQENLARHLGTIREVVARLLRNFAAQGLVTLAPRKIAIVDSDAFKARFAAPPGD